ncbi:MAG: hypothetical protein QOE55_6490, partial [Acidobacteriaceae bacterium]|nr:hypothetical protein [Acidobacteriaceae bacterium]
MATAHFVCWSQVNGGRGWNRTTNLSIKSRMLCQLSYASGRAGKAECQQHSGDGRVERVLQHDQGHRLNALVAQLFGTGPFHSHDGSAERLAFPQNAQLSRDETGCRKSFARTVKLA